MEYGKILFRGQELEVGGGDGGGAFNGYCQQFRTFKKNSVKFKLEVGQGK